VRLPILQLPCRFFFWAKRLITQVFQHPYSPDLAPCNFWFFPKLKSPLTVRTSVNATVTQYTSSVNGVSLPTYKPHGRVTVHGYTVRSPLTSCQVTSRPRDRFSRYSEWLNTFRAGLAHVFCLCVSVYLRITPEAPCKILQVNAEIQVTSGINFNNVLFIFLCLI
jgi:hypothetical protein